MFHMTTRRPVANVVLSNRFFLLFHGYSLFFSALGVCLWDRWDCLSFYRIVLYFYTVSAFSAADYAWAAHSIVGGPEYTRGVVYFTEQI